MSELGSIIDLAQGGIVAVLIAGIVALWRRLNAVQDRFTAYLEESARHGDIAAQNVLNSHSRAKSKEPPF